MPDKPEPVVLDLALLPREQMGPFLILGVDKDAGREPIEAGWARRVIWARKGQTKVSLEDVNWARDTLHDPARRLRADAVSLNLDTGDGLLARCARAFGADGTAGEAGLGWTPWDAERPWPEELLPDRPGPDEYRPPLPPAPAGLPALDRLLDDLARAPLDPWTLDLPAEPSPEPIAAKGPAS